MVEQAAQPFLEIRKEQTYCHSRAKPTISWNRFCENATRMARLPAFVSGSASSTKIFPRLILLVECANDLQKVVVVIVEVLWGLYKLSKLSVAQRRLDEFRRSYIRMQFGKGHRRYGSEIGVVSTASDAIAKLLRDLQRPKLTLSNWISAHMRPYFAFEASNHS
jgi:hypothetical protein